MREKIIDHIKTLFHDGKIDAFLGLRSAQGHIGPHLFTGPEELETLHLGDVNQPGDTRYPLNATLKELMKLYPDKTFGILVRGCDERGLIELHKWNQLSLERVVRVGIACPQDLAQRCACEVPYPEEWIVGEKAEGTSSEALQSFESMEMKERFRFWMDEFEKCIKCYGCRNICPMCFCKECTLEDPDLVRKPLLPTENPIFHLTRAVHMMGRCIDCGLCEEACPAHIPLRTLYKKVVDIVAMDTGYRPGKRVDEKCPLNMV